MFRAAVRAAIHAGRKIALDYRDKDQRASQRIIWPILLGYFQTTRLICAWCELRDDYRHFRADRVRAASLLADGFADRAGALLAGWVELTRAGPA